MTDVNIKNFLTGKVDRQAVADYAVAKILEQGKASVGGDASCKYRSTEGRKCAIGWLIPDDEYQYRMDAGLANGSHQIIERYYSDVSKSQDDIEFLSDLQRVHDAAFNDSIAFVNKGKGEFVDLFKDRAATFYGKYNLAWSL
jgi:hypothetical protein